MLIIALHALQADRDPVLASTQPMAIEHTQTHLQPDFVVHVMSLHSLYVYF